MGKVKDLSGMRFEKLTVLERDVNKKGNMTYWICRCDCGNIKSIRRDKLLSKGRDKTYSCGCHRKENRRIDETGNRYGKLVVIGLKGSRNGRLYWTCKCDCGNIVHVSGKQLRRDDGKGTRSCGCIKSSIGEENIAKILIENNIEFEREYSFKELGALRYDFAIMENGEVVRLIEFDGEQHYNPNCKFYTEEGVKRDKLKNDFALKNNIPLIRITYDKRDTVTLEDLL